MHLTSLVIFDEFVFENVVIGNVVFVASRAISRNKICVKQMHNGGEVEVLKFIDDSEINSSPILEWKTRASTNDLATKIGRVGYQLGSKFNVSKGMVVKDRQAHLRARKTKTSELPFILGKNMDRYRLSYDFYTTYEELEIVGGTKVLSKHMAVPRVLIRRTGDTVCATYSAKPELVESTLYIMTGRNKNDLKVALGLLNSKLMTYYARQSFVTNQQAFPQIVMSNLLRLPMGQPNAKQQEQMLSFVDRILAAKKRDSEADTSALEREIDQLVYKLYGLTEEEIKIVEGAID